MSTLRCICRKRGEVFSATTLALYGQYDRHAELVLDPQCPVHGDSPAAKADRAAWAKELSLVNQLTVALTGLRFRYDNEGDLQIGIAQALREAGIHFQRERCLGQDRIDFFVPYPQAAPDRHRAVLRAILPFRGPDPAAQGIGVEVKVAGAPMLVTRQLLRYAYYPEVAELMLLTTRHQHRQVPRELGGKPVHVLLLGND